MSTTNLISDAASGNPPRPLATPPDTGGERAVKIPRILGSWLFSTAYALWLGGLVALGAFMAANVAATLHNGLIVAGGEPFRRAVLNGIVGASFREFNYFCRGCFFAMFLGSFLEIAGRFGLQISRYKRLTIIRLYILVSAAATLIVQSIIYSDMSFAQAADNMIQFNSLHHEYELVAMVQLPLLLAVGLITALREEFTRYDRN